MTEHVHEWDWSLFGDGFSCLICGRLASVADVIRALSATERLSAERARRIAYAIRHEDKNEPAGLGGWPHYLDAYADILEDKSG